MVDVPDAYDTYPDEVSLKTENAPVRRHVPTLHTHVNTEKTNYSSPSQPKSEMPPEEKKNRAPGTAFKFAASPQQTEQIKKVGLPTSSGTDKPRGNGSYKSNSDELPI